MIYCGRKEAGICNRLLSQLSALLHGIRRGGSCGSGCERARSGELNALF